MSVTPELKEALIKLGTTNPELRQHIRPLLAGELLEPDWALLRKNKGLQPAEEAPTDAPDTYSQQVPLLKNLVAGDKVEITFMDPQRGGVVKTVRIISHSWQDLKTGHPGSFNKPYVLLQPKVAGRHKDGMISDYGDQVVWQPTLSTQVRRVVRLRRI